MEKLFEKLTQWLFSIALDVVHFAQLYLWIIALILLAVFLAQRAYKIYKKYDYDYGDKKERTLEYQTVYVKFAIQRTSIIAVLTMAIYVALYYIEQYLG